MHDHDAQHDCSCGCGCGGDPPAPGPDQLGIDWAQAPDQELVCPCAGVSKGQVLEAMAQGANTLALLKIMTGAGRARERECQQKSPRQRSCQGDLLALLALYASKGPACPGPGGGC